MYHNNLFQDQQNKYINISHITEISSQGTFSEDEVIAVNDLLLTNGYHTIVVKNITIGRAIIHMFLSLLKRYKHISWLSAEDTYDNNVYALLQQQQHDEDKADLIDMYTRFIYEEFHGDCLIIECTNQLKIEIWYPYFKQALYDTHVGNHIPIVQLVYEIWATQ